MLVVTRRIGEQLVIDGDICIKVVAVKGDRVQLGTTATQSVSVDRAEVHERHSDIPASPAAPVDPMLESLASDLADVAYRVALRHGIGDGWLELELDLWGALTAALEKRFCSFKEIQLPYDPRLDID
jgi:carbon storage regulator